MCEHVLGYLLLAAGTWFWCWYLVEEANFHKGRHRNKWYNRELFDKHKRGE